MDSIKIENKKYKRLRINLSDKFSENYNPKYNEKCLTKNKQTDILILSYLDDVDLNNICFVSKYTYFLCQDENLWNYKFQIKYLKYLQYENIYKTGSWKDYYLRLSSFVYDDFPYFLFLMATKFERSDILILLKEIRNVVYDPEGCKCHDCNSKADCVECNCWNCGKSSTCSKHCICRCYHCFELILSPENQCNEVFCRFYEKSFYNTFKVLIDF